MIKNILANAFGRAVSVLSAYIFLPIYIAVLGIENYSIISFSLILFGLLAFFDAGLTATLSRELAAHHPHAEMKMRMFSTLELCYLLVAIFICCNFLIFGDFLARNWLNLNETSPEEIAPVMRIVGATIATQMLANFYAGGLIGLERQVVANAYQVSWGLIRNGLVIFPILFFPSLLVFFGWQLLVNIVFLILLRFSVISSVAKRTGAVYRTVFSVQELKKVSNFATGMFLISVVAGINSQLDKVVISKALSIEELGMYYIATSLALVVIVAVSPFSIATLPRFTKLYTSQAHVEANELFSKVLLIVTVIVFSITAHIVLHGRSLVMIWINNVEIADSVATYIPYLAIGSALLAFQVIPFNVAIANGHTRINNYLGIVSLVLTVPCYLLAIPRYGALGAAIVWLVLQGLVFPVYFYFINRRFSVTTSLTRLALSHFLLPGIVACSAASLLAYFEPAHTGRLMPLLWVIMSTCVTMFVCATLCLPAARYRKGLREFIKLD